MEIGIIGMGSMGREMARNLVAAGHAVTAWNRSGGAVDGVRMVDAPVHALQADVALTMLSDDVAIRAVLLDAKLLQQARPGRSHRRSRSRSRTSWSRFIARRASLMWLRRCSGAPTSRRRAS
ncbi:hypothetical protein BVI2075_1250008 [Burkholderia vietnamiensis]|nr:hypothetical protein BVI2075_1250008 [Burkholderia vietnamiensis]